MRALTETETQTVSLPSAIVKASLTQIQLFSKLANYTGPSLKQLITPVSSSSSKEEIRYVFRMHQSRVYYMPLSLANLATSIARPNLLSVGTCLGVYTNL